MKFFYTQKHIAFLEREYPKRRVPELTEAFNRRFGLSKTPAQIRATLRNYGLRSGRNPGFEKGERTSMSKAQVRFLEKQFKTHTLPELTAAFNKKFGTSKKVSSIRAYVKNHGIKSGRTGHFSKGHKPWNDGTKGKGVCKPNSGTFKKGNVPARVKPLGHERICSKDDYVLIKVAEPNPYTGHKTRYRHKHVVLWEAKHGPVPPGHIVTFRDGDKRNFDDDNLVLVTRGQHGLYNKNRINREFPPELVPIAKNIIDLKLNIARRQKNDQ